MSINREAGEKLRWEDVEDSYGEETGEGMAGGVETLAGPSGCWRWPGCLYRVCVWTSVTEY